jgi:hypothetical protein
MHALVVFTSHVQDAPRAGLKPLRRLPPTFTQLLRATHHDSLNTHNHAPQHISHSHLCSLHLSLRLPACLQTIFRHPEASSKAIKRCLPFKTTVGFSNMKGPAGSWSLSGYRVSNIHNGVQPMAFGSFISLFSYDSSITFTHSCFETKTKTPEVGALCRRGFGGGGRVWGRVGGRP